MKEITHPAFGDVNTFQAIAGHVEGCEGCFMRLPLLILPPVNLYSGLYG
jgi:hypothetical protein